ncbi:MAG: N2,N2-dimethylguanosine tRNA methyltransferase, partial [Desulfurococcaceae archaeon]
MKPFDHEEIVSEGLTKLLIPRMDLYRRPDGSVEPAWMPVFYNPEAVISRDLTVLFLKAIMGKSNFFFVDLLSGTGIRGLRIAVEVGGYGILNDVDPRAYHYIRRNIALNNLEDRVEAYNNEANALLNTLVFTGVFVDYIDVDPYGSPVPFLDSIF